MRIIVATGLNIGTAEYQNMGDVAMLQVAVRRLKYLWPSALIDVLTDSPSDLARYCPEARALPRAGCVTWFGDHVLLGRYYRFLPRWVSGVLSASARVLGSYSPALLDMLIRLRLTFGKSNGRQEAFQSLSNGLKSADLLIVCGSGGFADSCRDWNLWILSTMDAAIRHGVPVAMFGQGMGPLHDPVVLSRAAYILPKVSLITLRGSRDGQSLLASLGVDGAKIRITGDEAVDPAYNARVRESGTAIGVNLRVASYAQVKNDTIDSVGAVLQGFARRRNCSLLPIPIAFHEYASDHRTIRRLLAGLDDESDGGLSLDTPLKLIRQTGRCRIVVTGAYHAAVFALAQGIPAVCLSNSAYYSAKFQGLQDLFGPGCCIVALEEPDFPLHLARAMEEAWASAEAVRSSLLQSALAQLEDSRQAYCHWHDLLSLPSTELHMVPSAIA